MIFDNQSALITNRNKLFIMTTMRKGPKHDDLGYGESRTPLFFEYVQANIAIAVNVGMEHLGPECYLYISF